MHRSHVVHVTGVFFKNIAIIVIAASIAGCSGNKIDPGFVAERWASTLSAFNIDPVFPPRFMQPGDVYLVMEPEDRDNDRSRYKRRSLRLGRAEVRQTLMDDAQRELLLPNTGNSNPRYNIFNEPEKVVRLRPMGFTGFSIAEVTEADIGAAAPIQAIRALFGFAGTNNLAMSISIPNAEFIELPALDAFDALVAFCSPSGTEDLCSTDDVRIKFAMGNLRLPDDSPNLKLSPKIVIVTHVYYARQIDYAYTTKGGAALGVSAALAPQTKDAAANSTAKSPTGAGASPSTSGTSASAAPSASSSPASGITTTTTTTVTTTTSNANSGAAVAGSSGSATSAGAKGSTLTANPPVTQSEAEQEKAVLEGRLDAINKQLGIAGPAGSLHVLSTSSEGTVLRQTFDLPIAIGYRGLSMVPKKSMWQSTAAGTGAGTDGR